MLARRRACCLASLWLLPACGDPAIEVQPACASARLLDVPALAITRSGRTLDASWRVGQLASDGSHTPLIELDIDLVIPTRFVAFEHDAQSGRMWVATWSFDADEQAWLFQFDASGQLAWSDPLDALGDIQHASLIHHDGALYVALRVLAQDQVPRLRVERRDLDGEPQWVNDALLDASGEPFAHAELRGVAAGTLAMLATPPLIDYGPSYPLTLELDSGERVWLDGAGTDSIALAPFDDALYVAWSYNAQLDVEAELHGERIELVPARSHLRASTTSGSPLAATAQVEWPEGFGATVQSLDIELAPLGDRLASLVQGNGVLGLTLHSREGELVCQSLLDVPVLGLLGPAQALEGREQVAIVVDAAELDDVSALGILLLEPLE